MLRPSRSIARPARRGGVRRRLLVAVATSSLLLVSACTDNGGDDSDDGGGGKSASESGQKSVEGSIEIQPLFVQGDSGGVGHETLSRKAGEDGEFRLEFSEDEVAGLGDASRAAAWNASIVSTLLTGQPLEGTFGFEIEGRIDGPSAGALTTVGLLALQRGDELLEGVTMTGTINATGSIGPVGGIPEKVKGAGENGITKVLIPLGQRNSPDHTGATVDVVEVGERAGVEVVEVGDIYEAYPLLTGEELTAPASGTDPRLDNAAYDKVQAQTNATFARFQEAQSRFAGLPIEAQRSLQATGVLAEARNGQREAKDLQRQGLIAGAFGKAQEAAMYMETLAAAGDLLTPLFTQGLPGLDTIIDRALNTGPAETRFTAFLDQLATYQPKNVPDVEAITVAYARAFDAYTLLDYATGEIDSLRGQYEKGTVPNIEQMFTSLSMALLYAELSKTMITNAESIFELARDNAGPALDPDLDLAPVGDFFRRGADANYAAFTTSGLVAQIGEQEGVSTDVVIGYLSQYDLNVAAAQHQQAMLPAFEDYLGEDSPNADYAAMGYGVSNYVRNQVLVEKYYNNAILDENFQVTGVQFQGALNNSLDLSRDQLAGEVAALREAEMSPLLTVGSYESAGLMATGDDPVDDFDALAEYSYGFVNARLLAYAGGLQGENAIES